MRRAAEIVLAFSSMVLNRVLASVLTEIGAIDAPVLAGASGLILIAAIAACALPALRASRMDPLVALRSEI